MEIVKVCRICLVVDVEMKDLQSYPYSKYFGPLLSGSDLLTVVNSPPNACNDCADLIKKFYYLRQTFQKSQGLLYELLDTSGQIVLSELRQLNRQSLLATPNPSKVVSDCPVSETINSAVGQETLVKEENDIDDNKSINTKADSDVKEENDYDLVFLESRMSSDDDEPLCKLKSLKDEDDFDADKITANDVGFEDIDDDETDTYKPPAQPTIKRYTYERSKKRKKGQKTFKHYKKADMEELLDYINIINLSLEEQMEEINKRKESSNYLNSPFQCELCYKGFIEPNAWKHHLQKHSTSAGDLECPICKFRFKTRRLLQKHSANHERKYQCQSCPYLSSNKTQAKQHQAWHKGVTYKCKYCDEVFTVWTSYMSHVRIKHPSEFICDICGYSYVSKLGLSMHKTMMHKDVKEKGDDVSPEGPYCEECDVRFVSMEAYNRHMVMSTKHTKNTETIAGCRTCGMTFENAEEYRLHHRKEHARKRPKNYGKRGTNMNFPMKCEHCSEEIPNGRALWTHYRRRHADKDYPAQKDYICDVCGKSFRGNAFLVYHKRTHTEERAYKCSQCDKAFFNRTNLLMHEKTHSDNRPHACSVCFKAFKGKGALTRHFRTHTGQKPYECEVCGKSFSQSNSRKVHVTTVHLKQPAPYVSRRRNKTGDKFILPETQFLY